MFIFTFLKSYKWHQVVQRISYWIEGVVSDLPVVFLSANIAATELWLVNQYTLVTLLKSKKSLCEIAG